MGNSPWKVAFFCPFDFLEKATEELLILDYINQVKTAIQETKKVALQFKNENQRDYALLAMARIKRMQDEVDEVESAQAEGVEI